MRKKFKSVHHPLKLINYLIEAKKPFQLDQTIFTKKLTCEYGKYRWVSQVSGIKRSDLSFVGMVKKYVESMAFDVKVDRSNTEYIREGMKNNVHYTKEIHEIDLTGAYWYEAFDSGYISELLFKRGLTVDKKVRLIALGNLAKRVCNLSFDGEKFQPCTFTDSKITENVFFDVSQKVDALMKQLIFISGDGFLFFWCDAIFVRGKKARDDVIEFLEIHERKYKTITIDSIIKRDSLVETRDETHIKRTNPEGKRSFNFRKNKVIKPFSKRTNGKTAKNKIPIRVAYDKQVDKKPMHYPASLFEQFGGEEKPE